MKNNLMSYFLIATLMMLSMACEPKDAGPPLPPAESMKMDLSTFNQSAQNALTYGGKEDGAGEKSNFNNAALRVAWLNAAILLALTPPAAVFAIAVSVEPVFADGKWLWEYTHTASGKEYTARLTGWFDGNLKEGTWLNLAMHVTCPGCAVPTDNYLWYEGRFKIDGGEGYWQFYNPEITTDDQTFVRIDYSITDDTHKTLTFTNKRTDGHEDAADVILYARDGVILSVDVHDANEALDYNVTWSTETGEGSIEVPGYNEGNKACWDGGQLNAECAQ